MTTSSPPSDYVLGSTKAEHERLIRQAARLKPLTERLFLDAGIGPGQKVLDIGSGAGDVALLAAEIVGPTGLVVGVDRDAIALAGARARAVAAGVENISFVEADVGQFAADTRFDAVVGRLVLQFLPDPAGLLRGLAQSLRPGGVMVFQEANWASFLAQAAHLPLRTACAELILETFRRGGAHIDMERVLYRAFRQIGLPAPELRLETPVGADAETRRWVYDLFCTARERFAQFGLSEERVGDFATLAERLDAELDATDSYAACIGLVAAWSRKPGD